MVFELSFESFYDIANEILGKQCNRTRPAIINEMMRKYRISDKRASVGFQQLVDSNAIELTTVETNVDRYYMADSTPF